MPRWPWRSRKALDVDVVLRSRAATTETQYSEDTKTSNGMIPSPKARQLRPTRRDTSDCTLLDRYDTDESVVLGRGAWGKVYTARSKTNGEVVAVKTMSVGDMFESEVANVRREVEILRRLQHPNIVRVLEMFDDTWDGELHVVMELCSESLVGRLQEEDSARDGRASSSGERGYDERRVASLFRQLLRAVWYCHSNGVVHRDIKLSNLTYSTAALPGAELRLIDFGLAKQYDGTDALQERVGTPAYLAPELLGPPPLAYDSKVDLWACGVVLYQLLCGALPFEAPDGSAREQRRRIREEPLSLDGAAWADVSEAATDLVRKLLRKEADHRPPASAALEHAWLAEEAPTGQRLPRSVLRSLLAFSQASELKKLAFEAAAASAPQESLETLNRIWAGLDDGSGSLSYDRWQAHVAAHHPELTPRLAERLFAQMAGGGQRVTYHAFVNAAIMCREQSLTLPSAFALLDADGDGLVSEKDVERLVQQQESRRSGSRRSGDGGGDDGGGGGGSGDGGRDDSPAAAAAASAKELFAGRSEPLTYDAFRTEMLRRATATASTRNLLQQSGGLERATSALSLLNSGGLAKLSTSQGSASTSSGDADDGDAQSRLFRRMLDTPPRRPPHQPAFATLKEVSSSSSRGSVLARISERISRATGRRSSRALGQRSVARPPHLARARLAAPARHDGHRGGREQPDRIARSRSLRRGQDLGVFRQCRILC